MHTTDVTRALNELSIELHGESSSPACVFLCILVLTHCTCLIELDLGSEVQRLPGPLSPLQFYREFVSKNKPCLLTGDGTQWLLALDKCAVSAEAEGLKLCAGAIEDWSALSIWNQQYLTDKLHSKQVLSYLQQALNMV